MAEDATIPEPTPRTGTELARCGDAEVIAAVVGGSWRGTGWEGMVAAMLGMEGGLLALFAAVTASAGLGVAGVGFFTGAVLLLRRTRMRGDPRAYSGPLSVFSNPDRITCVRCLQGDPDGRIVEVLVETVDGRGVVLGVPAYRLAAFLEAVRHVAPLARLELASTPLPPARLLRG